MSLIDEVIDAIAAIRDKINVVNNNKVTEVTTAASHTPNLDTTDIFVITAQAEAVSFVNPSGTKRQEKPFMVRIKDNGTARAITWGTQYVARGQTLPTTTVVGKIMRIGFRVNTTTSTLDCVAVSTEA